MEEASCLKDIVKAASQYQVSKTDSNLVQLQRQLDVLITITKKGDLGFLKSQDLLVVECLTCLIDILKGQRTMLQLTQKTIQLLDQMANVSCIRDSLHSDFHAGAVLTPYLRHDKTSESCVVLCVRLLQKITYGHKVSFKNNYVEELLYFLLEKILSPPSEITEPCLGLFASLCRNNFIIQTHIKNSMTKINLKQLFASLVPNTSNKNHRLVAFSFSIFLSLAMDQEIGQKLFSARNINKTFMLIVNILMNDTDVMTRTYVIDLFIDMLQQEKIQHYLAVYTQLPTCTEKLCTLILKSNKYQTVSKILELLLSFCSINGVRNIVCKVLLNSTIGVESSGLRLMGNQMMDPFLALIHWAAQSVNECFDAPLLAMELLKEIYEDVSSLDVNMSHQTELLLPMLSNILQSAIPLDKAKPPVHRHTQKVIEALKLLRCVKSDDSLRLQVVNNVRVEICQRIVEHYYLYKLPMSSSSSSVSPLECQDEFTEVVLFTLDLMMGLEACSAGMKSTLQDLLQNQHSVTFLAHGMKSSKREVVQTSLSLVAKGASSIDFPLLYLGDTIASINSASQVKTNSEIVDPSVLSTENSVSWHAGRNRLFNHENKENSFSSASVVSMQSSVLMPKNPNSSSDVDANVTSLIEKINSSLDVKDDLKTSDILRVYDHKFQSLQTKENHLQDLLDAKAMALEQADRLIAQYRCRKTQADVEAQKMRKLIHDSEKQCEELRESLNDSVLEKENLQAKLEDLIQENSRLEHTAEEYKEILQSYNEQSQTLNNLQKTLSNLSLEYKDSKESHEMMRRHYDKLKQQHDVASQQLAELEEERKSLSQQLKEKEAKNIELTKTAKKMETKIGKLENDREELEHATDKLQGTLDKSEKMKKEFQQKVKTLELLCQKHEADVSEKEKEMASMKSELDKHAQIAALIHNLSKGNTETK